MSIDSGDRNLSLKFSFLCIHPSNMQRNAKRQPSILPHQNEGGVGLGELHIAGKAPGVFCSPAPPWSQTIAQDRASVVCRDESCDTEKTAADAIFWFRVLADFH